MSTFRRLLNSPPGEDHLDCDSATPYSDTGDGNYRDQDSVEAASPERSPEHHRADTPTWSDSPVQLSWKTPDLAGSGKLQFQWDLLPWGWSVLQMDDELVARKETQLEDGSTFCTPGLAFTNVLLDLTKVVQPSGGQ